MINPERFTKGEKLQHHVALAFFEKFLRQGYVRSEGIQDRATGALAGCDEVLRRFRDVAVPQRHLTQYHIAIEGRLPVDSAVGTEPFLGISDGFIQRARCQRGLSQSW